MRENSDSNGRSGGRMMARRCCMVVIANQVWLAIGIRAGRWVKSRGTRRGGVYAICFGCLISGDTSSVKRGSLDLGELKIMMIARRVKLYIIGRLWTVRSS